MIGKISFLCFLGTILLLVIPSAVSSECDSERKTVTTPDSTIAGTSMILQPPLGSPIVPDSMSDEDWLLLADKIPTGISYQEVRRLVPMVGDLMSEGARPYSPDNRLTEAFADIMIFGLNTRMEFNFCRDSLYTYYYWIRRIDSTTAEETYGRLKSFYSKSFGDFEDYLETREYFEESCLWRTKTIHLSLVKSIYSRKSAIVSWGR